jgi:uncharacterized protein YjbI with pentapeptide repeats
MSPRSSRKKNSALVLKTTIPVPLRTVEFKGGDEEGFFQREVRGMELSGVLHGSRTARACNIVETVIRSLTAESADFTNCDFKDSAIRSSRFIDSQFGSSSLAYNAVSKCTFERCSFPDTDIQNCEFEETVFVDCDLQHLLVKTCIFSRCEFRNCQTSNQVFETCRLTDCLFEGTELQLQTITDNFGITNAAYKGQIRDNRSDLPHRRHPTDQLHQFLKSTSFHPLQKLNLYFFIKGTLLEGSQYLDECLNLSAWVLTFRTATSFSVSLNQWVEFLLWLYERDSVTVHTIIALHSMTDDLTKALTTQRSHHRLLSLITGAHLSLARAVDQYLVILENAAHLPSVSLLVEGHGKNTVSYYQRALVLLFKRSRAQITRLVPHNSPWELGITFTQGGGALFFMGLLLATRTRIELSRIKKTIEDRLNQPALPPVKTKSRHPKQAKGAKHLPPDPILALDFGSGKSMPKNPTFRFRAYLPGNLMAELKLNIGSQQIAKLRKTVRDLL